MSALAVATLETDLTGALELGGRALSFAEVTKRPVLASASLVADALVLGALQRQDTLRARSPARFELPLARRFTTGTEAQLSGPALYHALALPHVAALFPDASARTLLNRNIRVILRGYAGAGVPLRYFGTEVLALLGRPVALVGYDRRGSGALLIEIFIGLETPAVVRSALKREAPSALWPLLRATPNPHDFLQRAVASIVERQGAASDDVTASLLSQPAPSASVLPPMPAPASVLIPLGVVEASPSPLIITGDLLASTAALSRFTAAVSAAHDAGSSLDAALAALQGEPLDGARPADLLQVVSAALAR